MQSDYCIRVDAQWTIDGAERAQHTTFFSACHMNHAGGRAANVARQTFRRQREVRFYASRNIQVLGPEIRQRHPALADNICSTDASCFLHYRCVLPFDRAVLSLDSALGPFGLGSSPSRAAAVDSLAEKRLSWAVQAGEELLLDYGSVYWTGREHLIID